MVADTKGPVTFTWEQQVYIVRAFAVPRSVNSIIATMHTVYQVRCKAEDLLRFDPQYRTLPPDLHQIYVQTRDEIEKDPSKIVPLISPMNQQITLATSAKDAFDNNNPELGADLLEQLAKLQNDFYSGKKPKGEDGKADGPMSFTFNLDKANGKQPD